MIKKVIHIADVHIPNMEDKRPYSAMLDKFCDELETYVSQYDRDEIRIVVAGDMFHHKIKVSNEGVSMFHSLLNKLNGMAKTYIIAGNHDMLENNKQRTDSITPTFSIEGAYPNVVYLDKELNYKSGYFVDDNVTFALYSMHDNFAKPNLLKTKKEHKENRIIGLYHGEIPGATTDLGRKSESGIDINDFKGCDCVMAGHIHKFQEIRKGKGAPIVYAGSLFQQDRGEKIEGHGFVAWDMETMEYEHVETDNDYRILRFKIGSYDDIKEDKEKLVNSSEI
ncbi:MAG: metallophosphoesterase family protein [Bacteroidales bacterium]|nr:metallophosphoesterase family protein [Bacteroidales bacterium]